MNLQFWKDQAAGLIEKGREVLDTSGVLDKGGAIGGLMNLLGKGSNGNEPQVGNWKTYYGGGLNFHGNELDFGYIKTIIEDHFENLLIISSIVHKDDKNVHKLQIKLKGDNVEEQNASKLLIEADDRKKAVYELLLACVNSPKPVVIRLQYREANPIARFALPHALDIGDVMDIFEFLDAGKTRKVTSAISVLIHEIAEAFWAQTRVAIVASNKTDFNPAFNEGHENFPRVFGDAHNKALEVQARVAGVYKITFQGYGKGSAETIESHYKETSGGTTKVETIDIYKGGNVTNTILNTRDRGKY